jgi:galactokinase
MEGAGDLSTDSRPPWSEKIADAFQERFRRPPQVVSRAPGRVNLLGAHVDHQEGWVLPGAIDRAIWLAAGRRHDRRLLLHALDFGEVLEIELDALPPPRPERAGDRASWADLPTGVAWALQLSGTKPCGMDAVFGGDLPIGAGVSSSAAVEMAFLLAWEQLGDFSLDDVSRARLGRRVENDYLGVGSGLMDQLVSLKGRNGEVLLIDCRTLHCEAVPLPPGLVVLMADSIGRRRLVESGYNSRQQECAEALSRLRRRFPGLQTLRDLTADDLRKVAGYLEPRLERRVRHVVTECARVLVGVEALETGDLEKLGSLMRSSHESSRDLFEVSTRELDLLAEVAWSQPGCYGARLSGGGFGGFVGALVEEEALDAVQGALSEAFSRSFDRSTSFFTCRFAEGARVIPYLDPEPR